MTKRSVLVAVVAATSLVLTACGGSGDSGSPTPAPTTAEATTGESSAAETTDITEPTESEATESETAESSESATTSSAPTTTIGADVTELDTESTAWFDTFCTGIAPFSDFATEAPNVSTPQELGSLMTGVGTAFRTTGEELSGMPAPTFEGGDVIATEIQTNMQNGGTLFENYGAQMSELQQEDVAEGQALVQQFQQDAAGFTLYSFQPAPELQQAVRAIPSCASIFAG